MLDPTEERSQRVGRLLRVAVVAAGASGFISLAFTYFELFEAVTGHSPGGRRSVAGVIFLLVTTSGIALARLRVSRLRRFGPRGTVTIGRVCAEMIAVVILLGTLPAWAAAGELHEWWAYYKPLAALHHTPLSVTAIAAVAVCIVGVVWALCARDDLPRIPLVPDDLDD